MPGATPLPRMPTQLVLYGAGDLLKRRGCPVCHYVAESSDRFFTWFAMETHTEAEMIERLGSSLGMCPPHTRLLLRQPGADVRMTAVYRHVLAAVRTHLTARVFTPRPCPACAHDTAAADRALETLLDELADPGIRRRYAEQGGLCVPHLHRALRRRGDGAYTLLAETALAGLRDTRLDRPMLTGGDTGDAGARAAFRAALPPHRQAAPSESRQALRDACDRLAAVCPICQAAAQEERACLAGVAAWYGLAGPGRGPSMGDLCRTHLCDAAATDEVRSAGILARHRDRQIVVLERILVRTGHRGRLRPRRAPVLEGEACPLCAAVDERARAETTVILRGLTIPWFTRAYEQGHGVCVRHLGGLPKAGKRDRHEVAVPRRVAVAHLDVLIEELTSAQGTPTRPDGDEPSPAQRAAAFLDGRVYGGGPPRRL